MPYSPSSLMKIIQENKEKKVAASKIIQSQPKNIPILAKLTASPDVNVDDKRNIKLKNNINVLKDIHDKISNSKRDALNITKLFPDLELSKQIMVSSVLSPKKMTDIQLNYKLSKDFNINSSVLTSLIEVLKEYVEEQYNITERLPAIVEEALFESGAYAIALIPESTVDEVINKDLLPSFSTEEFHQRADIYLNNITRNTGILGTVGYKTHTTEDIKADPKKFSEYLVSESFVNISDNTNILNLANVKSSITNMMIKKSIQSRTSITLESRDKIDYLDIFRKRNAVTKDNEVEFLKLSDQTRRKSIGKPMTMKIPTEAIIPVIVPGDKTNHIGYFVLLDENSRPLSAELSNSSVSAANTLITQPDKANPTTPTQVAFNNMINNEMNKVDLKQLFELYKETLEKQLFGSIKNSLYGKDVELGNHNEIYYLMFIRALADQKTSLLFIPEQLVTYFAFDYTDYGVGLSLLDNMSVLSSLRAITMFSKIMAYCKTAIDVTNVNVELDPKDMDPEKTIEQIQDSVLKLRQNFFPLGINNPLELVNWIQRAGLRFSYSNNPAIPNVNLTFTNDNIQHTMPSSDLDEFLKNQSILAVGLSPETVDNSSSPEFATTVTNNNILLSKRIGVYQSKLEKHLSKFLTSIVTIDEDLRAKLKKQILETKQELIADLEDHEKALLEKNEHEFIDYYINKFGQSVYISLPRPDNTNIANLSTEYDIYKENLDKTLDSVISVELFAEDMTGDLANHIETIRNIYKHHLLRKWMVDNNFYPEVLELVGANTEEIKTLVDNISGHLVHTMSNSSKLFNVMQKFKDASNASLQQLGDEESSSSSSSSASDNESSEPNNDDLDGFGDLNLNF